MFKMFNKREPYSIEIPRSTFEDLSAAFPEEVRDFINEFLLNRIENTLTDTPKAKELQNALLRACTYFTCNAFNTEKDAKPALLQFLEYKKQKDASESFWGGFTSSSSFYKSLSEVMDSHQDLSLGRKTQTRKAFNNYLNDKYSFEKSNDDRDETYDDTKCSRSEGTLGSPSSFRSAS